MCSSFIRLCDYLVVTMLHDLAVKSTSHILDILKIQTARDAEITNLVRELPDDIEEQEKMLQVHLSNNYFDCAGTLYLYVSAHCHSM